MLEGLKAVDWNKLGAEQVPQYLRSIYSCDSKDDECTKAFLELNELLYPEGIMDNWDWGGPRRMMQNDLPHIVTPFLIEIVQETQSINKKYALVGLLRDLCTYETVYRWLGEDGQAQFLDWSRRLRDQVRLGLPLYEQLLGDGDEYLKKYVQDLIKWMEYKEIRD